MALQSSGQITLSEIWSEYNSGATPGANQNISLGSLSVNTADGGGDPDAMSEFYGLSSAPPFVNTENFDISLYTGNGGANSIDAAPAGKSAVFNGSSGYVQLPLSSFFGQKRTCSISLWFKAGTQSNNGTIFIDYSGRYNIEIRLLTNGTIATQTYYGTLPSTITTTTSTYNDNNWHHIVVVNDISAGTRKTYIDGSQVLSGSLPSGTFSGSTNYAVTLGVLKTSSPISGTYYNGKIDQVRIYDTALSASDVINLYNETNVPTANLIAYYKLDGNANDSAGSYNATATSITYAPDVPVGPSLSGKAAHFNGSNGYISVNDSTALRLIGDYTISYWVKQNNISGAQRHLNKDDAQDHSAGWGMYTYNGQVSITHNNGSNNNWDTGFYISPNTWYHLCVTYSDSGNIRRFYVNGSQHSTFYTSANLTGENDYLFFGAYGDQFTPPAGQYLNGSLDQVRIYSATLSAAEVFNLFTETNARTSNLVAHYKLDGNANDETGNYNGTPANISWVGIDFRPDLVWIKDRDGAYNHALFNSVIGYGTASDSNALVSNNDQYEGWASPAYGYLSSFNASGFDLSQGSINTDSISRNGAKYAAWAWKAGGPAVTNTDGTTTSQVSANQAAGFSIVKVNSAVGTAADVIGHGLSQAPEMIIYKTISTTGNWSVYHSALGNTKGVYLNLTNAEVTSIYFWNNTSPTSSVFTAWGSQGNAHIAFCFHSVSGYQKVGSYIGAGTSQTISVGFQPRFVMIKRATGGNLNGWVLSDYKRGAGKNLFANTSQVEANESAYGPTSFTSNGFTLAQNGGNTNASGSKYIYLAIA